MSITSKRKTFPAIGTLAILSGVFIVAHGIGSLNQEDSTHTWFNILIGICIVIGWTTKVINQIVEIIMSDEVIEYRKRNGASLVIRRSDVIDSEVRSSRIKFRYKGPLDVQNASIPLRCFDEKDVERLMKIFTNEEEAQQ